MAMGNGLTIQLKYTPSQTRLKTRHTFLFPGHLRYASANLDLVLAVHKHNFLLAELRSAALATIHERYPDQDWLYVFTDGSAIASFGRAVELGLSPTLLILKNLLVPDLAVGESWSCLLDGQRRTQLSALPRVEGVTCFRIITGHDYLQAHLFKIGLADSPLCPLCKSVPMTGENLSDCPALLHVISQDNCGVLLPARATSALYWTARRLVSVIKKKFQNKNSI
ncbi:hydroxysteroid dehydrogenase-like protein 1 [Trichonephila clavipes]|nr:hydroxysteroid dehydrogenase-like protein 1 [Trichonephila clavipes]